MATNALELGVDIGSLDAVLMLGFPMSVPSFVSVSANKLDATDHDYSETTSRSSRP